MIALPTINKKYYTILAVFGISIAALFIPSQTYATQKSVSYSNVCYPAGLSHGDVIVQVKYIYDTNTGMVRPLQGDNSINIYNQTDSSIGINLAQSEGVNSGTTSYVWASWSGAYGDYFPINAGATGSFRVGRKLTTDSSGHLVWVNETYPPGWHIQPNTEAAVLGNAYMRGTVGAAAWLAHGGAHPGQIHVEGIYGSNSTWWQCQVEMVAQ